MARNVLGFLFKVCSLTGTFLTILVAIFGISQHRISPNSHVYTPSSKFAPHKDIHQKSTVPLPAAFQQDIDNLINPEHHDAYIDSLKTKNWCDIDQTTCDKIIRDASYSAVQQLRYQTLTIGLLNTIDAMLTQGNPSKACLSRLSLYKNELASRGSATHTTIKMNTQPVASYREYWQVLTHELGHVIDLCSLEGVSDTLDKKFTEFGDTVFGVDDPSLAFYKISRESERTRKSGSATQDFISGYAQKNPFEDKAESANAYLNHPKKFQQLATLNPILAKKYAYFDTLYGANHFDIQEYPTKIKNTKKRVWDTTRWEE